MADQTVSTAASAINTTVYTSLGGAALGGVAGAFMSKKGSSRVLWALGGIVLGGAAGGVVGSLLGASKLTSAIQQIGAGSPPRRLASPTMQLSPQLSPRRVAA